MSLRHMLSEQYLGKIISVSHPEYDTGIPVIITKSYDNTFIFEALNDSIYISPFDYDDLVWLEDLPDSTHTYRCTECGGNSISYSDGAEYDPSICPSCCNRIKSLNTFIVAECVYRFNTNQELKTIVKLIDGCCHHFDNEDEMHLADQGLVVTDTHQGEFDDYSITWYRILPKSLFEL